MDAARRRRGAAGPGRMAGPGVERSAVGCPCGGRRRCPLAARRGRGSCRAGGRGGSARPGGPCAGVASAGPARCSRPALGHGADTSGGPGDPVRRRTAGPGRHDGGGAVHVPGHGVGRAGHGSRPGPGHGRRPHPGLPGVPVRDPRRAVRADGAVRGGLVAGGRSSLHGSGRSRVRRRAGLGVRCRRGLAAGPNRPAGPAGSRCRRPAGGASGRIPGDGARRGRGSRPRAVCRGARRHRPADARAGAVPVRSDRRGHGPARRPPARRIRGHGPVRPGRLGAPGRLGRRHARGVHAPGDRPGAAPRSAAPAPRPAGLLLDGVRPRARRHPRAEPRRGLGRSALDAPPAAGPGGTAGHPPGRPAPPPGAAGARRRGAGPGHAARTRPVRRAGDGGPPPLGASRPRRTPAARTRGDVRAADPGRAAGAGGPGENELSRGYGILSPSRARFSMAARPYSAVSLVDTQVASLPGTSAAGPLSFSVRQGADSL